MRKKMRKSPKYPISVRSYDLAEMQNCEFGKRFCEYGNKFWILFLNFAHYY